MVCFPFSLKNATARDLRPAVLLHATFSLRGGAVWATLRDRTFLSASTNCHSEFFGGLLIQSSRYRKFIGLLEFAQSLLSFAVKCSVHGTWIQSFSFQGFLGFLNIVRRHTGHPLRLNS